MTNAFHYRLTPDARADLIEIHRYTLAQWGTEQSKQYLSELRQIMSLLSETPKIGTRRPALGHEIFSFPHSSHVIYYQCSTKPIIVFGVLHTSLLPMAHLEDRGTS